jgi:hypothetical protein
MVLFGMLLMLQRGWTKVEGWAKDAMKEEA